MRNNTETSRQQTLPFGEDASTSLPAASPASRSASRASAGARRTTATSGRKCCGLFGLFDLAGSWARTFSESLIGRKEWSSNRCALTWKRRDTRYNRSLYQLAVSALPTSDTEHGLLPTPAVMEDRRKPNGNQDRTKKIMSNLNPYSATALLPTVQTQGLKQCQDGKTVFIPLEMLPTPTASEGEKYTTKYNPDSQMGKGLTALAMNGMLPTPAARDWKGRTNPGTVKAGCGNKYGDTLPDAILKLLPTPKASDHQSPGNHGTGGQDLRTVVSSRTGGTSQLNPLFVAEMMGFPADWTVLPFQAGESNLSKGSEMPSCRR